MEEQIREWNPRKQIKIKYMVDKNHFNYWETTANELYSHIKKIVDDYMKKKIRLSNRQLYYRLVGIDFIPNRIEVYKRICKFITDLRYGGYIDWDAIEDRGRVPKRKPQWETVQDLIDTAVDSYRLPRWSDQEYYIELYCEKEAMDSVLRPIADKYHIYFGYNKGYCSASTMYDTAKRVYKQLQNGKKVTLLYLGDHDPSGIDMIRDVDDRIVEFIKIWKIKESIKKDKNWKEKTFEDKTAIIMCFLHKFKVEQVALTYDQIKEYDPPSNPAKFTDPRAKEYVSKYGKISWELDSIEPEVLIQLTENKILEHIDLEKYNNWIRKENADTKKLVEFGKTLGT